jgi:hypothetical protein
MVYLGLQFQKMQFKITTLKCVILQFKKKKILKMQLSVGQNCGLAFKILRFQKSIILSTI